jgi:hypothetical protein
MDRLSCCLPYNLALCCNQTATKRLEQGLPSPANAGEHGGGKIAVSEALSFVFVFVCFWGMTHELHGVIHARVSMVA